MTLKAQLDEASVNKELPQQIERNDAARLVWAMNHMGLGSTHSEFSAHVLSVGGVGDLADCRVFVDAQMQK